MVLVSGGSGRTTLLQQMRRTVAHHAMLAAGERVLVAVSGGPDSVALLSALAALRRRAGIELCAAHFNHRLRGAESGAILRQLIRRCLIAVVQRGEAASREAAYGTTPRFLEWFGLQSLDDLPRTQDLQQL